MKLLTQSDDYGFTRGVTCGILDAIENGVVRNTGLFVNMPESEHAGILYPRLSAGVLWHRLQYCLRRSGL